MTAQPDVSIVPIYCSGCGRSRGMRFRYTARRRVDRMYCDEGCMLRPPVQEEGQRDRLIVALANDGVSQTRLGDLFGVTRARVNQILRIKEDFRQTSGLVTAMLTPAQWQAKSNAGKRGGKARYGLPPE